MFGPLADVVIWAREKGGKSDERTLVSEFLFCLRYSLKSAHGKKKIWGYLQSILLCIVWELARGRSVAVAVGNSDM